MRCKGAADASAAGVRRHHEGGVGHMRARAGLIWMQFGRAENITALFGEEYAPTRLSDPPLSRGPLAGVGRPAVCVAGPDDSLHDWPDGRPVVFDRIPDTQHATILSPPHRDRQRGFGAAIDGADGGTARACYRDDLAPCWLSADRLAMLRSDGYG